MSKRNQPEYRGGSVGGGFVLLVLILAVVLVFDEAPPQPTPDGPDINIAIELPTAPTTTPTPTTSVELLGSSAAGTPTNQSSSGVAGAAELGQRARDWAQDYALDCLIGKLTGRGLCLPWPNHLS